MLTLSIVFGVLLISVTVLGWMLTWVVWHYRMKIQPSSFFILHALKLLLHNKLLACRSCNTRGIQYLGLKIATVLSKSWDSLSCKQVTGELRPLFVVSQSYSKLLRLLNVLTLIAGDWFNTLTTAVAPFCLVTTTTMLWYRGSCS